jgi:hypothetical protein
MDEVFLSCWKQIGSSQPFGGVWTARTFPISGSAHRKAVIIPFAFGQGIRGFLSYRGLTSTLLLLREEFSAGKLPALHAKVNFP